MNHETRTAAQFRRGLSRTAWLAMSLMTGSTLAAADIAKAGGGEAGGNEAAFRVLYKELVEIDTTRSAGSCTRAAEVMRARLRAAGFDEQQLRLLAPADRPQDGALIAELPGRDRSLKPILLLAHIDVVEARREDWQRDPFTLVEEDGWFYARGASDDKAMAAIFTDSLIRYRRAGFVPRRGLKLALTCGEETPDVFDSVEWLLKTHPEALDAVFALNEGASGELDGAGRHVTLQIQAGEKVFQNFELIATDGGGHSSRPTRRNAIVQLSNALTRLGAYRFPVQINPVTRAYFEQQSALSPASADDLRAVLDGPDDLRDAAADRLWDANPGWNSMLRTTCVVTRIDGGHADNALPQRARANVNCRILPGVPIAQVREDLLRAVDDAGITISATGPIAITAPIPPMTAAILDPVRDIAAELWPGVSVVPTLATGATDGRFLNAAGIPTYGLSGIFHDAEGPRAHGLNERIRVRSLMDSRRFLHTIVKRYADAP